MSPLLKSITRRIALDADHPNLTDPGKDDDNIDPRDGTVTQALKFCLGKLSPDDYAQLEQILVPSEAADAAWVVTGTGPRQPAQDATMRQQRKLRALSDPGFTQRFPGLGW